MSENKNRSAWVNLRSSSDSKAKINVNDISGIFPNDRFDVTMYEKDNGTPRFHVESNNIDLVFSLEDCRLLYKSEDTIDEKEEEYVLQNVNIWYLKNKYLMDAYWLSGHCEMADNDLSDKNLNRICDEYYQKKS